MRKFTIGLALLLVLAAQPAQASAPTTLQLYPGSCTLKSYLPAVFFAAFECTRCCEAAEASYQACKTSKGSTCDCIRTAVDTCIFAGCGPCMCCESWYDTGVWQGCQMQKRPSEVSRR